MALDLPSLLKKRFHQTIAWSERDCEIYSAGISADGGEASPRPASPRPAPFPTIAAAIARNAAPNMADLGGVLAQTVLLAHQLRLREPFPLVGEASAESFVCGVLDRGEKGLVVAVQTDLMGPAGLLATSVAQLLARADGGGGSGAPPPQIPPVPTRAFDDRRQLKTRLDQAVLYARFGDANPLHLDPAAARERGFRGPILHGLCTYALAAKAVVDVCCDRDASRLVEHQARFLGPVYPGETLQIDFWRQQGSVAFEVRVLEQDLKAVCSGWSAIRA